MIKVEVALSFSQPGYIGLPYWPERNTLINIQKDVHPKLSDEKKQAAILAACAKRGITPEEFERIKRDADRPFYTINGGKSEIIIPERIIQSFTNNCSQVAPKAVPRIQSKGLTFVGLKCPGGLHTGKTEEDSVEFARFVKLEESNQRTFSVSLAIENFMAEGRFDLDPDIIPPDNLLKLFEWGGRYVGIGSARPQGYGRFTVARWDFPKPKSESKPVS